MEVFLHYTFPKPKNHDKNRSGDQENHNIEHRRNQDNDDDANSCNLIQREDNYKEIEWNHLITF